MSYPFVFHVDDAPDEFLLLEPAYRQAEQAKDYEDEHHIDVIMLANLPQNEDRRFCHELGARAALTESDPFTLLQESTAPRQSVTIVACQVAL